MPVPDVAALWGLRVELEQVKLAKRGDTPAWKAAWRARERWHPRWEREMHREVIKHQRGVDLSKLAKRGQKTWGRVKKASVPPPSPEEVAAMLRTEIAQEEFIEGAMAVYLALGGDESEDSGQFTLNALGLDETFSWAQQREFAKNTFAVHGSKVLTSIYETHIDKLAKMVVEKCDPKQPKTIGQLTKEIGAEWDQLTRAQAKVIARTESAFVWETTNYNAMNLNGVENVDWLVATGPSIGKSVGPVCKECLGLAAQSPYTLAEMDEIPPGHPNCRCTLVPIYDPEWLPPAEPFTGGMKTLEIFT